MGQAKRFILKKIGVTALGDSIADNVTGPISDYYQTYIFDRIIPNTIDQLGL